MRNTNFYFDTAGIKGYLLYLKEMQSNMKGIIAKGKAATESVIDFNDNVIISSIDKVNEISDNLNKMTNIMEHMSVEAYKLHKMFDEYNERI